MRAIQIHSKKIGEARAELRRRLQSAESAQAIDHLLCRHLSCSRAELHTKDGDIMEGNLNALIEALRRQAQLEKLAGDASDASDTNSL